MFATSPHLDSPFREVALVLVCTAARRSLRKHTNRSWEGDNRQGDAPAEPDQPKPGRSLALPVVFFADLRPEECVEMWLQSSTRRITVTPVRNAPEFSAERISDNYLTRPG